ncbi:molybdopterin-binding protein [Neosynechococcus sphagnicola]|uniref:molybdopterin-binding protein n=1 Tax=Neosynechococcus sphagnicola TaxID=1501145 RepID=UPI000AD1BCC0
MNQGAEIICVGTELLLGDIVNTNAQFLSQQLAQLGIPHYYQTVVGDNPVRLKRVLAIACERSQILIFTGGFGAYP